MAINIYESREEFAQAQFPKDQSTIGIINEGGDLIYKGVNAFTTQPGIGDIVLLNDAKALKFVKRGTYSAKSVSNPSGIPTTWDKVGVVGNRFGNKLLIIHKTNTTKKWLDFYWWRVTGWTLDGAEHATTITLHTGTASRAVEFTYTANTKEEVAAQLTTFFNTNLSSYDNQRYQGIIVDGEVVIQKDTFTNYQQYQCACSGLTVTNLVAEETPATTSVTPIINGKTGRHPSNVYRYIDYYGATTTDDPTTAVSAIPNQPCSYTFYNSANGAWLRSVYGEGIEGYRKYIADYMIKTPDFKGIGSETFRYGKVNTDRMSGTILTYGSDTPKEKYPSAAYCRSINYDCDGLRAGDWFMPSIYELNQFLPMITYGTTLWTSNPDPINLSLDAIGGTKISVSSCIWSSVRSVARTAWRSYSCGQWDTNSFTLGHAVVPCSLLEI